MSDIENIVFIVTDQSFFGDALKERVERVKNVQIDDTLENNNATVPFFSAFFNGLKIRLRVCVLPLLFAGMLSGWSCFDHDQLKGEFFRAKYPSCTEVDTLAEIRKMGNGQCDGSFYNTLRCGFDHGDCADFKLAYPDCEAGEGEAILIGNGKCDPKYNIAECLYDEGDCCPFDKNSMKFTNGVCDGGLYNTNGCNYDNYECEGFNVAYPKCPVDELALRVDSLNQSVVLGNQVCESVVYISEECGYENGDCKECAELIRREDGTTSLLGNGICNGYPYILKECLYDGNDCDECI